MVLIYFAWKVAKEDQHAHINTHLANRLKQQKSTWQIELIRSFPNHVWLKKDLDNFPDGSVFSVRWKSGSIISTDGDEKWNAEHIPADIAQSLLTKSEFLTAIQKKI